MIWPFLTVLTKTNEQWWVGSTQSNYSLVPLFFVVRMEMLKVQANLEHDKGHSLYSGCSLINGTRGITITYPSCPHRCPKGHRTPAGVVAVGWEDSGQCFVQLLDYKNKWGTNGEKKTHWLVVFSLEEGYSVCVYYYVVSVCYSQMYVLVHFCVWLSE